MEKRYGVGGGEVAVQVKPEGESYRVTVGDRVYRVAVRRQGAGVLTLDIDGRQTQVVVAADGTRRWVAVDGATYVLEPTTGRRGGRQSGGGAGPLTAQMPGQVAGVYVAMGDKVEKGQKLVLLEAMKMELQVAAPYAGQVHALHVTPGEVVKRGQTLVEVEPTA
jgi:biotin carboxyl carrier protein